MYPKSNAYPGTKSLPNTKAIIMSQESDRNFAALAAASSLSETRLIHLQYTLTKKKQQSHLNLAQLLCNAILMRY
jgi:hypothetical protein